MATKQINQYAAAVATDAAADYLLLDPAGTGAYKKINRNTYLGLASQPLGLTDSQSPTNKIFNNTNSLTIKDDSLTVQNTADTTKQAILSAAGITTGTTRTLTLPNRTDTLVTLAGTESLTNKTITSPTITGGTYDNGTITVDSISGHSVGTIVTVGGVQMNNGIVATAGAVNTNSIAAGAVVPNSLVASSGSGWAWTAFAPTWTNLTVGNGTNTGFYCQIGKMVWVTIVFVLGTTSAVGAVPKFTPPVGASAAYTTIAQNSICGYGYCGAGTTAGIAAPFFNSTNGFISLGFYAPSATSNSLMAASSTLPGTWATGNNFSITCFYQAA